MSNESLEARIKNLEDIENIKKLMFNYTYWLDYGELDKALDCFSENAIMDVKVRGELKENDTNFELHFEGIEQITNFYNAFVHQPDHFSAAHLIVNPVVEVDGDRATGIFYLLEPTCVARAMWGNGRYDMEFVRAGGGNGAQGGAWKINRFGFLWNFNSPHSEGWDKLRVAIV